MDRTVRPSYVFRHTSDDKLHLHRHTDLGAFHPPHSYETLIASLRSICSVRAQGKGFMDIARALDVRAQDIRDIMLGLVTFAIEGEASNRLRSRADLRVI